MNGREMVKDIADFVKANRLEDLELQDFEDFTFSFYFNEEHTDEIEYTFDPVHWTETIKHLKWGGEDNGYIIEEQVLTREEALRLRFPNEAKTPRARMYTIIISSNYPLSCAQDIFEELKRRFLTACSELGKGSIHKEQMKLVEMRGYYKISMFMTKSNFARVLDQLDYEVSPGRGKTYYIFKSFKEEK